MGAATIIGSLSYASLIALGVSSVNTMLIMLSVPIIEAATFWILLRNPRRISQKSSELDSRNSVSDPEGRSKDVEYKMSFSEKIRYIPSVLKYIIPMSLVFFSEYFINQGLVCITRYL